MKKYTAITLALLAAALYALNTPISKIILNDMPSTMMAGFLYLGAGVGIGFFYLFHWHNESPEKRLHKSDRWPTIGMIVLDVFAPILLMHGIRIGSAANASLLGNFEIVATSVIAYLAFKEKVSAKLWTAIVIITASSILLSLDSGSFEFSPGSLYVVLATLCWGLENNCTERISDKSTYQIVVLKGIFSGITALLIALILGESFPALYTIAAAMILGFFAYGLSIFTYIRAQRDLGAAVTSAFYAVAPFIAAFLSLAIFGEKLNLNFYIAFLLMCLGTGFVVLDTLSESHEHEHTHLIYHTHDGKRHYHSVTHVHSHEHCFNTERHMHYHSPKVFKKQLNELHRS